MSIFAIQFKKEEQVRYAIATQGDPEYNGIDSGNLEDAKTWKTSKGAKKYLETHVLVNRQGDRIRTR